MNNVVRFKRPDEKPRDPHLAGEAKCIGCGEEWHAIAPVGTVTLECPQCNAMRGVWRYPVRANEGDLLYRCKCGCEALTAYQREGFFYVKCMACGTEHTEALFG